MWRDYGALVTGGNMQSGEVRMDFELERMSADFAEEVEAKINLLPANIREVRTIDIQGLDVQADGGTHVNNTTEVGRIRVVGHESKGRINQRLRIALDD